MIRLSRFLIPILLLFPATALAQDEQKPDPIDKQLEACMAKDGSTAGSVACTDKASSAWDTELNKAYTALMAKMNAEGKLSLKTAQLSWIKYRDTEFKLLDAMHSRLQGSMYIPMEAATKMDVVKQRAVQLRNYLELAGDF
jgi:uncharacterized protein YecT (DUF1311 family)